MNNGSGYIYVLMNSTMQNLVKIGMTTRDPEARVQELSQATGVPTPFILVYKEYFYNCFAAEQKIHTALEKYRVSTSREFFEIPIYNAIELIQKLKSSDEDNPVVNSIEKNHSFDDLSEEFFEQAEDFYYGRKGKLEDPVEALVYYEKAAKLGCAKAYTKAGKMYENGEGVTTNNKKAMTYYKEAIKAGDIKANALMALLFLNPHSGYLNSLNATKCWDSYFHYIEEHGIEFEDKMNMYNYLFTSLLYNTKISYIDVLINYKSEILDHIERLMKFPDLIIDNTKIKNVINNNFIINNDLVKDFQGRVRDLFGYKGNAVLHVEIISGMITIGSTITVRKGSTIKQAIVELIDLDGDFVTQAGAVNKEVSLVLKDVPERDFNSFRSGSLIELAKETV